MAATRCCAAVVSSAVVAAIAGLLLGGAATAAETVKFEDPVWQGNYVSYCILEGVACGFPAAQKFCALMGEGDAVSYPKWQNPVEQGQATVYMGDGTICKHRGCASFVHITCIKTSKSAAPTGIRFAYPQLGAYYLDWCKRWGEQCGKPAADAYCRHKGHSEAVDFRKLEDVGNTRVIVGGRKCLNPDCDGFEFITCR
ncbi:MAG: hypothetical protein GC150_12880 [Rhizobiales bacterium]|nr:hypothetical protein [Hyphomicrobiales bacterium]